LTFVFASFYKKKALLEKKKPQSHCQKQSLFLFLILAVQTVAWTKGLDDR
jgi:hypothetical protein